MRLQRLEITGFKSFSDRSELAFDEGVTAIVGPNGCGKSNVADAITWVLGEQSAKSLRGDRMEDVIFSGSDARKPTAAAEVRLRLGGVTTVPASSRSGSGEEPTRSTKRNGNGNANGTATATATVPTATAHGADVDRRSRGRGHAAAVPVGRERVPDRRADVPAARRPRAADGHRARREGLRDHRAGQDRA